MGFSPVKLDADWHAAALQMDLRQIKTRTSGHRDCMPSPVTTPTHHDLYLLCVRSFCSRKQGVSSCGESVGSLAGKPRWGCILPTLGGKNIKSWSSFPACTSSESLRESLQDLSSGWPEAPAKEKKKKKLAQQDNLKITTRFLLPITSGQTQKLFWRTSSLLWEDKKNPDRLVWQRKKSHPWISVLLLAGTAEPSEL